MAIVNAIGRSLVYFGEGLQHLILLAMRLYWGLSFFMTGIGKLSNITPVIDYFHSLGIPFPTLNAYAAASVETVCGLCLAIGLASRLVSIPLIIVMIVAYSTAHVDAVKTIFDDPQNFVSQQPFNYLLTGLIVLAFGPGIFSVDALIKYGLKNQKGL